MKIKLLTSLGDKTNAYLNSTALLKTAHKTIKTTFILDTGSPQTILSYNDSRRLQISFSDIPVEEYINLGGRKFSAISYNKLKITFLSEDSKPITEELENIKIIKPTSPKDVEELDRIPTILGTDFLKKKNYKLFCDMANDVAYLEK